MWFQACQHRFKTTTTNLTQVNPASSWAWTRPSLENPASLNFPRILTDFGMVRSRSMQTPHWQGSICRGLLAIIGNRVLFMTAIRYLGTIIISPTTHWKPLSVQPSAFCWQPWPLWPCAVLQLWLLQWTGPLGLVSAETQLCSIDYLSWKELPSGWLVRSIFQPLSRGKTSWNTTVPKPQPFFFLMLSALPFFPWLDGWLGKFKPGLSCWLS